MQDAKKILNGGIFQTQRVLLSLQIFFYTFGIDAGGGKIQRCVQTGLVSAIKKVIPTLSTIGSCPKKNFQLDNRKNRQKEKY